MLLDTQSVSKWFVANKGFKVYPVCPACGEDAIVYFRAWRKGQFGIAPECTSCKKALPVRFKSKKSEIIHWRQFGLLP